MINASLGDNGLATYGNISEVISKSSDWTYSNDSATIDLIFLIVGMFVFIITANYLYQEYRKQK